MIFYYDIVGKELIEIHIRMEADDGTIAEGIQDLHPGEDFMGVPFKDFLEGNGEMEIDLSA